MPLCHLCWRSCIARVESNLRGISHRWIVFFIGKSVSYLLSHSSSRVPPHESASADHQHYKAVPLVFNTGLKP